MEIRAARPSDHGAIHALLTAHGWAHRIPDVDWLARLLSRSQSLVAVRAEEIVGFARGVTDGLSNGYLSMVVVAETHRRSGVGALLVRELMGSDPGVTWVLRADRPGARQFFERLGFSASSTAMERKRS
jgi:ribosomal protein S18 acetylase RimI-like enzyme